MLNAVMGLNNLILAGKDRTGVTSMLILDVRVLSTSFLIEC